MFLYMFYLIVLTSGKISLFIFIFNFWASIFSSKFCLLMLILDLIFGFVLLLKSKLGILFPRLCYGLSSNSFLLKGRIMMRKYFMHN